MRWRRENAIRYGNGGTECDCNGERGRLRKGTERKGKERNAEKRELMRICKERREGGRRKGKLPRQGKNTEKIKDRERGR